PCRLLESAIRRLEKIIQSEAPQQAFYSNCCFNLTAPSPPACGGRGRDPLRSNGRVRWATDASEVVAAEAHLTLPLPRGNGPLPLPAARGEGLKSAPSAEAVKPGRVV